VKDIFTQRQAHYLTGTMFRIDDGWGYVDDDGYAAFPAR
jgi:hypothetical protein